MAIVGACFGFAINQCRDNPLPLVYAGKAERIQQVVSTISEKICKADLPEKDAARDAPVVQYLDLAAFRQFVDEKGVVLDARPKIFYRSGHIPSAVSFPREDFETTYDKHRLLLEKNKAQPIAVYCSNSGCEDSQLVADALLKLAYRNVYVFKGGWSEWDGAHLPEEHEK